MRRFRINDSKKVFDRPKISRKNLISIPRESLVEIISSYEPKDDNYTILVESSLIPDEYTNGRHFLHHGMRARLKVPKSMSDKNARAIDLRRKMFPKKEINNQVPLTDLEKVWKVYSRKLNENIAYSGFSWKGFRTPYKHLQLVNCIEGAEIFAFSERTRYNIRVLKYENIKDVDFYGAKALFEVPSRSKNKRLVSLSYLPIPGTFEAEHIVYDIQGKCQCEWNISDVRFRYTSGEDIFCPHMIAAYLEASKNSYFEHDILLPEIFPIVNDKLVLFWQKARHHVLKKVFLKDKNNKPRYNKNNTIKTRITPLDDADLEILLFEYSIKEGAKTGLGHDAMLKTHRKIKNYDWVYEY